MTRLDEQTTTELRAARDRIRQLERALEALLNNAPNGVRSKNLTLAIHDGWHTLGRRP